ncbi:MAG: DMT family transporter [Deltaproteobacteria bacterium]|nr:DMT family transporter [Candidatus Zymogenaceae bacterium]
MNLSIFIALFITVTLWASAFVGIKAALVDYSPVHLAVFRYLVASIVLVPVAVFRKIRIPTLSELPRFLLIGVSGISIYNILLNIGEKTTTAASACFIINTAVVITAVISVLFLKEKVRGVGWLGMLVSLAGVGVIAFGEGEGGVSADVGSLFVFIAAICTSIYFVVQKPLLVTYSSLEVVTYAIWFGTLFMLPGLIGIGEEVAGASLFSTLAVVYLGVFPAVVAYVAWSFVLSRMPASRAATFLYVVPVLSIVLGFLVIHEMPTVVSLVGGGVVLFGVFVVNRFG